MGCWLSCLVFVPGCVGKPRGSASAGVCDAAQPRAPGWGEQAAVSAVCTASHGRGFGAGVSWYSAMFSSSVLP